jgi:hypothetical protein
MTGVEGGGIVGTQDPHRVAEKVGEHVDGAQGISPPPPGRSRGPA